jgi:subtilisin family serine protease
MSRSTGNTFAAGDDWKQVLWFDFSSAHNLEAVTLVQAAGNTSNDGWRLYIPYIFSPDAIEDPTTPSAGSFPYLSLPKNWNYIQFARSGGVGPIYLKRMATFGLGSVLVDVIPNAFGKGTLKMEDPGLVFCGNRMGRDVIGGGGK